MHFQIKAKFQDHCAVLVKVVILTLGRDLVRLIEGERSLSDLWVLKK